MQNVGYSSHLFIGHHISRIILVSKYIFISVFKIKIHTHVFQTQRHKRDTTSLIDYALNLFYTGQTYTVPAIKLDVTNNGYCGYRYRYNSYYLRDIIGQDSSVTSLESCIRGCMNLQTCVAVNYIQSLSQCVALTNFGPTLDDIFYPVEGSLHAFFTDCPSSK